MADENEPDKGTVYEFRVVGKLDQTWSDWFDGFTITPQNGETVLVGMVADQAALLGILTKFSRLNLPLIAANRREAKNKTC